VGPGRGTGILQQLGQRLGHAGQPGRLRLRHARRGAGAGQAERRGDA
jgi:hypothetical protein